MLSAIKIEKYCLSPYSTLHDPLGVSAENTTADTLRNTCLEKKNT